MTNLEKNFEWGMKPMIHDAFDRVATNARSTHSIASQIKYRNDVPRRNSGEHLSPPVILRLDLPATANNVERIRERIRLLNRKLEASGTDLRLRMI